MVEWGGPASTLVTGGSRGARDALAVVEAGRGTTLVSGPPEKVAVIVRAMENVRFP